MVKYLKNIASNLTCHRKQQYKETGRDIYGYGKKIYCGLHCRFEINGKKEERKIFHICISNNGSSYVLINNEMYFVDFFQDEIKPY